MLKKQGQTPICLGKAEIPGKPSEISHPWQNPWASSQLSWHPDIHERCRNNQVALSASPFSCCPFLCGCSSLMKICCKIAVPPNLSFPRVPSLTPAPSIWQSWAARALNHPGFPWIQLVVISNSYFPYPWGDRAFSRCLKATGWATDRTLMDGGRAFPYSHSQPMRVFDIPAAQLSIGE